MTRRSRAIDRCLQERRSDSFPLMVRLNRHAPEVGVPGGGPFDCDGAYDPPSPAHCDQHRHGSKSSMGRRRGQHGSGVRPRGVLCAIRFEGGVKTVKNAADVRRSRQTYPDALQREHQLIRIEDQSANLKVAAPALHAPDVLPRWVSETAVAPTECARPCYSEPLLPEFRPFLDAYDRKQARVASMPLYTDTHKNMKGVTAAAVAEAHAKDLKVQGKQRVEYIHYWVDEKNGTIQCLVNAPTAEAAARVHEEAHGLVADEIHEVKQG